jgi:hypothetical protein
MVLERVRDLGVEHLVNMARLEHPVISVNFETLNLAVVVAVTVDVH